MTDPIRTKTEELLREIETDLVEDGIHHDDWPDSARGRFYYSVWEASRDYEAEQA